VAAYLMVLFQLRGVVRRHLQTAEVDHLGAEGQMQVVQRRTFTHGSLLADVTARQARLRRLARIVAGGCEQRTTEGTPARWADLTGTDRESSAPLSGVPSDGSAGSPAAGRPPPESAQAARRAPIRPRWSSRRCAPPGCPSRTDA